MIGNINSLYQDFIYKRTYARWIEGEKRREEWPETVGRYIDFFTMKYPQFKDQFENAYNAICNKEVMPSMRALWTAGPALEREGICQYNCSYIQIDYPKAFAELLYILMNGTGVGFSIEKQFLSRLPNLPTKLDLTKDVVVFADSKRGWAEGYYKILRYLWQGKDPKYDLSKIRPKGSRLKTFGGRASGPEVLADLIEFTKKTFYDAISNGNRKLNSIECFDIICMIASCVIVGGVRRSACIALTDLSDDRMAKAKMGQFFNQAPWRSFTNISVAYTERPNSRKLISEWLKLIESQSGERGIFNRIAADLKVQSNNRRIPGYDWGTNPCFTGDMRILTVDGYRKFEELDGKNIKLVGADGKIYDGKIWKSGIKKVVDIWFSRTSEGQKHISCTPDHVFQLTDGTSCKAKDLGGMQVKKFDKSYVVAVKIRERMFPEAVYDFLMSGLHWGVVEGFVVHNCGEIILRPNEFCNLTEVVVRPQDTLEDLEEKVRIATFLGVIQSTITNFNFISSYWIKNCEEERLLGVSLTGLQDHPVLQTISGIAMTWFSSLRKTAINTAREWSKKLDIAMPAAVTCCKPSGSVSALVDSSPGIHARYSRYYLRRVQISSIDPLAKLLIDSGLSYHPVDSAGNLFTFEFPLEAPKESRLVPDWDAISQLEYWKMVRDNWCEHNPSCTIYVRDREWPDVLSWVNKNWNYITGITFLPYQEHIYHLAPYEEITKDKYDELVEKFPKVNFKRLDKYEQSDNTEGSREFACVAGQCDI